MTSHDDSIPRRINDRINNGDKSAVLDDGAEREAAELLDTTIREVFPEHSLTIQRHRDVLFLVGMLYWTRFGASENDRDLLIATALLAPWRDTNPDAVPQPLLNLPAPSRPGQPQVEQWNDLVGMLVTGTKPDDRTALLAATAVLRVAVAMSERTPDPGRVRCLGSLSHVLALLYEASGDVEALVEAVRMARRAVADAPRGTPEHGRALRRLSDLLRLGYDASGDVDVLAEAIEHARSALRALPPDDKERVDATNNLALLLISRQNATGDTACGREAIGVLRGLVNELPPGHPAYARSVHNLALRLADGLDTDSGEADLDQLLDMRRLALDQTAPDDPLRPLTLASLSDLLRSRAKATGLADDLDEALSTARQAVAAVSPPGRVPGTALRSLALALAVRYDRLSDQADFDQAAGLLQRATTETVNEVERAELRFELAALYNNRYADTRDPADAQAAVTAFTAVATSPGASVYRQVHGTANAAKLLAELAEWDEASEQIAVAIELLPKLAGGHLSAGDRERGLGEFNWLPVHAASYVIAAGQLDRALEFLEWGRNILFAQDTAIRHGLNDLDRQAPDLAAALARLTTELATTDDSDRRGRIDRERTRLVDRIRQVDGFEDFLQPPRISEILDACREGPVVVPVLSRHRSDALIATAGGVRQIALPDLTFDGLRSPGMALLRGVDIVVDPRSTSEERRNAEDSIRRGLAWLWDALTGPVLDALGFLNPAPDSPLPRMWWCPTAFLSYLPLHAAGHPSGPNALDLAIPSYTPTVHALGQTRPRRPWRESPPLVVALPRTPDLPDLPAVEQELAHIVDSFPNCRILRGPAATRERIMTALPDHDIVHFACHGGHNPGQHHEGQLLVHDGALTLPDVAQARADRAGLAFLSACSTARHRIDLPDETLSVATGFQLAGFSHVIASLWPIADQTTTQVVADFYTQLRTSDDDGGDPARALHSAVRNLRTRQPDRPSRWAPYTHLGN